MLFQTYQYVKSAVSHSMQLIRMFTVGMDMEEGSNPRQKADEMGVEHLATLERLRQNQRQDYLKVS